MMSGRSSVTLEVHLCDQRRSFVVIFAEGSDAVAAAYVTRRRSYAAMGPVDESDPDWSLSPLLTEALDPQCEHGTSTQRCCGPGHFMSADQERAMGWEFNDDVSERFSSAE